MVIDGYRVLLIVSHELQSEKIRILDKLYKLGWVKEYSYSVQSENTKFSITFVENKHIYQLLLNKIKHNEIQN